LTESYKADVHNI